MPGGVRHRRVAQRDPTVPIEPPSPIKGCGTPVATAPSRTMSRLQSCVATNREIQLRPGVGEGRNTVLTRGCYASLVSESVHDRGGSSARIGRAELIGSRDAFHRVISRSLAAVRTASSTWLASFTRAVISPVIVLWAPALERLTHRCAISDFYEAPTAGWNKSR